MATIDQYNKFLHKQCIILVKESYTGKNNELNYYNLKKAFA